MATPSRSTIGNALLAFAIGFLTLHGGLNLVRMTAARETLILWTVIVAILAAMMGIATLRRKGRARRD